MRRWDLIDVSTSENRSGLVYLLSDIGCFNILVEGREGGTPKTGKGRGASHRVGGAASSGAIDQVVMSSLVDDVESGNRLISSEQKCSLEEEHGAFLLSPSLCLESSLPFPPLAQRGET